MQLFSTRIVTNTEIASQYHELTVPWSDEVPQPGQFLTLRVGHGTDPLLRRPFAFSKYDHDSGRASIIYERRGKATSTLAARSPGDEISVLGPLGHPFPAPELDAKPILISGGVGIGPMLFLARALSNSHPATTGVFGARTGSALPTGAILILGVSAILCTDDGSAGIAGTVIDGLSTIAEDPSHVFYACGPNPMMKSVSEFTQNRGARCWVSMEQIMGCAVGACMGCAIKTKATNKFARVCTEGPVFDAENIVW